MKQLKFFCFLPFFLSCNLESERSLIERNESQPLKWDTLGQCELLESDKHNFLALYYNKEVFQFNQKNCFSKKNGDTVILNLVRGVGPVDYLSIRVVNRKFLMIYSIEGERYSSKFVNLRASLFFCPDEITLNDSITFYINYKGVFYKESENTDTVQIEGKFKAKIHGENYNYETYKFERDSLKMISLLNENGIDTIREINFSRCGLKLLPEEVSKFKNLEYLTLDLNDLSQEDFRILVKLRKLKYLSVKRCNIEVFPKSLLEISSLEELDISNNEIDFIPNKILFMKNLQTLNIRRNKLSKIDDLLENNRKIDIIY